MDGILGDLPFCICCVDESLSFPRLRRSKIHMSTRFSSSSKTTPLLCTLTIDTSAPTGLSFSVTKPPKIASAHSCRKSRLSPNSSPPTTVKALLEFVGMVNYYHRLLPNIARMMAPFHDVLSGEPTVLQWGSSHSMAFEAANMALVDSTTLAYPVPNTKISLMMDASNVILLAVITLWSPM